ncbi:uncharacterized protein LOC121397347 [Xenopus laevis]|uniref:Uncharacterized protein LOC121397347 n=1 Tax=Xenopus laevis TaxID=8355 RepID=A0A8J1LK08_XENLA|nr:uncharacterized protein LOC121397347 [Xenopus laevis]
MRNTVIKLRRKMSLGYWKLIILALLPYTVYTGSCGPMRNITGKEGEAATLQVDPTRGRGISWALILGMSRNVFAITKPNSSIDIRDPQYKGRVNSTTDGSLNFMDFMIYDQGIYLSEVFYSHCSQFYNLRVYTNVLHHLDSSFYTNYPICSFTFPHPTINHYYFSNSSGKDLNQPGEYIYYLTGLTALALILGFIWFFVRKSRKRPDYEDQNVVEEMGAQSIQPQETENQRKKPRTQNDGNEQQNNPEPLYDPLMRSFID